MTETLFSEIEDRFITAYDLYGNDQQRNLNNFRFRVSAYGLLIEHGELLVKRTPILHCFELPGGGINLDETLEQGLLREFQEETGLTVKISTLIHVQDSFFTHDDIDIHGIQVFYIVTKISGEIVADFEDSVEAKFIPIQELQDDMLQRSFREVVRLVKEQQSC